MRSALFILLASATAAVALVVSTRSAIPRASACSIAPSTLEDHVRQAVFIGIVEPIVVGDGINRAPTFTPTATEAPSVTETPTASPTRRGFISLESATPRPTATSSRSSEQIETRLIGRSASVRVIEELYGTGETELRIDHAARAAYETGLRYEAAGLRGSCGLGFMPEYQVGTRYLLVARTYVTSDLYTFANYAIEGAGQAAQVDVRTLVVMETTYRRFLSDLPAELQQFSENERAAYVRPGPLPLERVAQLLLALRTGIAPPETGNAGLAANR